MLSLCILAVLTLIPLPVLAWAMARAARAVGSSHGRFGVGALVVLLMLFINTISALLAAQLPPMTPATALFVAPGIAAWTGDRSIPRDATGISATVPANFCAICAYLALTLLLWGLVLFVVRPFLTQAYLIPTQSMSPTIDLGNRILVNKILKPRRLDLVAYRADDHEIYCKRLIALPGERLRFDEGGISIDDKSLTLPAVIAGRCHAFVGVTPRLRDRYADGQEILLGDDEYFLLGDNLAISADSRIHGPSLGASLVGVVDAVYGPPGRIRLLRDFAGPRLRRPPRIKQRLPLRYTSTLPRAKQYSSCHESAGREGCEITQRRIRPLRRLIFQCGSRTATRDARWQPSLD